MDHGMRDFFRLRAEQSVVNDYCPVCFERIVDTTHVCIGCKDVMYCSASCRDEDWISHRAYCKGITGARSSRKLAFSSSENTANILCAAPLPSIATLRIQDAGNRNEVMLPVSRFWASGVKPPNLPQPVAIRPPPNPSHPVPVKLPSSVPQPLEVKLQQLDTPNASHPMAGELPSSVPQPLEVKLQQLDPPNASHPMAGELPSSVPQPLKVRLQQLDLKNDLEPSTQNVRVRPILTAKRSTLSIVKDDNIQF